MEECVKLRMSICYEYSLLSVRMGAMDKLVCPCKRRR